MNEARRHRLRILGAVLVAAAGLVLADLLVGARQSSALRERAELKKKLDRMIMYSLRADVQEVVYAGSRYLIRLRYDNPFPEDEIFMMAPSVRALVQVGTSWKEVPLSPVPGSEVEGVLKVDRPLVFEKVMEVPFRDFEEVLAGYMHVRVNSVSYVSSSALSKEDVAEKSEDFFLYLKPWFYEDRVVSAKYAFRDAKVPIWIPMPPH